jgi:hypothetical protein
MVQESFSIKGRVVTKVPYLDIAQEPLRKRCLSDLTWSAQKDHFPDEVFFDEF